MTTSRPQAANRPKEVDTSFWLWISACALYWISFLISYLQQGSYQQQGFRDEAIRQILADNPQLDRSTVENFLTAAIAGMLVLLLLIGVVLIVFVFLMRGGRNWARIVLAVLGGLILLFGIIGLLAVPSVGPQGVSGLSYILSLIPLGLLAGAVLMMFRPAANAWFRSPSPQL